ncbi:hypothetical protein EB796_024500 [Bugula neritina]|uniref:Uncharacterized protein n=1 Tax=Bugula neritina TaxID=10212 RepID=A0A7J7ITI7_BUGNE|nr:hypothetical protein EB796_024500 [Bugula neritina]
MYVYKADTPPHAFSRRERALLRNILCKPLTSFIRQQYIRESVRGRTLLKISAIWFEIDYSFTQSLAMSQLSVSKLYQSVIDEVIESMREAVLDEGIDEQVLTELKQLWEQKLKASKALEELPTPSHLPLPPVSSSRKPVAVAPAGSTSANSIPQTVP